MVIMSFGFPGIWSPLMVRMVESVRSVKDPVDLASQAPTISW